MKFLSKSESEEWLRKQGYEILEDGTPSFATTNHTVSSVRLPQKMSSLMVMTKTVWLNINVGRETLQWVTGWSIWPNSEHMKLSTLVRSALGASTSLQETPSALSAIEESDDALSLFLVAALFSWDCWLLPDSLDAPAAFISHDQYVDVFVPPNGSREIVRELSMFGTEITRKDRSLLH